MGDTEMPAVFTNPLMYWVGFDLDTDKADERQVATTFYVHTHLPEVLAANPGFTAGHLFERRDDGVERGGGPTYLAVYELSGEEAARIYLERNDGPADGRPRYTPGPPVWQEKFTPRWRMIWRRHGGPDLTATPIVVALGADYEPDAGATYELVRSLLHPAPGAPAWVAVSDRGALLPDDPAARWCLRYSPLAT